MNIKTVAGRLELYKKALQDWKESENDYFSSKARNTCSGFCFYFGETFQIKLELYLPELYSQKPVVKYNPFYWFGGVDSYKKRIECLEAAIRTCEDILAFLPEGVETGEICNRNGCDGIMQLEGDGCSCHINPPCSYCCQNPVCSECGFGEENQP